MYIFFFLCICLCFFILSYSFFLFFGSLLCFIVALLLFFPFLDPFWVLLWRFLFFTFFFYRVVLSCRSLWAGLRWISGFGEKGVAFIISWRSTVTPVVPDAAKTAENDVSQKQKNKPTHHRINATHPQSHKDKKEKNKVY